MSSQDAGDMVSVACCMVQGVEPAVAFGAGMIARVLVPGI